MYPHVCVKFKLSCTVSQKQITNVSVRRAITHAKSKRIVVVCMTVYPGDKLKRLFSNST